MEELSTIARQFREMDDENAREWGKTGLDWGMEPEVTARIS
jgi:hypothetical protein